MRALQFRAFGDPAAKLALVNLPDSRPRQGWAVIRVRAASVNPSEVGNVEGKMERTTLSRVPGRDYAGTVVQGPAEWTRSEVWRTGGEIGYSIDGSHAEPMAVPVASLRRKPEALSLEPAAAIGVAYLAA